MLIHVLAVWDTVIRQVQTGTASRLVAATRRGSRKRSPPSRWAHRFSLVSCWHWLSVEGFRKGSSSPQPCSFRTWLLRSRQHCKHTQWNIICTTSVVPNTVVRATNILDSFTVWALKSNCVCSSCLSLIEVKPLVSGQKFHKQNKKLWW